MAAATAKLGDRRGAKRKRGPIVAGARGLFSAAGGAGSAPRPRPPPPRAGRGVLPGLAPQHLALLFGGSDRAPELAADVAPELWRRQLGFMLDGLRTPDPRPLEHPPLTDAQLRRAGPRRRRARA